MGLYFCKRHYYRFGNLGIPLLLQTSNNLRVCASIPFAASITIIKTKKGDSLRIIQVCDTTIFISLKQMLSIIPDYTNYSNIALPFNTSKTDCEVKKTIYGKVWKP